LDIDLGELTEPVELRLNYECNAAGSIRVGLHALDRCARRQDGVAVEGRAAEQSTALTGEALAAPVAWQGVTVIAPVPGRRIVARLFMSRAQVYAFDTPPAGSLPSRGASLDSC
jgi:hypothetical protein